MSIVVVLVHGKRDTENGIPNNKDQEITEKLFSMMEKFAERLALMENQIRIAA